MRQRAGALYIKERKLFLICEGRKGFYWTPGGGLEAGETFKQALKRELMEELSADLLTAEPYLRIEDTEAQEVVQYYLVDITLPDRLPNDTTCYWYGKEAYTANSVPVSARIYANVFPKLIADTLV